MSPRNNPSLSHVIPHYRFITSTAFCLVEPHQFLPMSLPCIEVERAEVLHAVPSRPQSRHSSLRAGSPNRIPSAAQLMRHYFQDLSSWPLLHEHQVKDLVRLWTSAFRKKGPTPAKRIPNAKALLLARLCLRIWKTETAAWSYVWRALLTLTKDFSNWRRVLAPHHHLIHCLKALGPVTFYEKDCMGLLRQSMKSDRGELDAIHGSNAHQRRKDFMTIWLDCFYWGRNSEWESMTYRQFFRGAEELSTSFRPLFRKILVVFHDKHEMAKYLQRLALQVFNACDDCSYQLLKVRTRIARLPLIGWGYSLGCCLQDCLDLIPRKSEVRGMKTQLVRLNSSQSESHWFPNLLRLWSELGKARGLWELVATNSQGLVGGVPHLIDMTTLITIVNRKFWERNEDMHITEDSFEQWTSVCEVLPVDESMYLLEDLDLPETPTDFMEEPNENEAHKRQRLS